MYDITCDDCGSVLNIDMYKTMDEYYKDMDYIVGDTERIASDTVQKYLIYKCDLCNKVYKLTYKEWEERFRIDVAHKVMEVRKQKMFREEINPQSINPDNGLEYCGRCSGYAGDGHCFVDIIKQCTIRKK